MVLVPSASKRNDRFAERAWHEVKQRIFGEKIMRLTSLFTAAFLLAPLAWQMIKLRGLLTKPCSNDGHVHVQPAHGRSLWNHLQMLFARSGQPKAPNVNL
jgi:hypothetical protein